MILELVASRIVAPRLGVSLYTWTSIIGVILAGISLGNYIGGKLADRWASFPLLGCVFSFAALLCLGVLWLNNDLHDWVLSSHVPLLLAVVTYVAAVFFLPSVALGSVSPIVVKLSLKDLEHSGATVGKLSAWASVGSIVGTFATGFFLISWFGTKAIVLLVAITLELMGLWFLLAEAHRAKIRLMVGITLLLFAVLVLFLHKKGFLCRECPVESDYYCIRVFERVLEGHRVRALVLDRLVHSYTDLDDPTNLKYGYEEIYAQVIQPFLRHNPAPRVLCIGGGGYTFPRYLEITLPESQIKVIEIDPAVTEVAHVAFGLPRDTRIQTYNMDARYFLAHENKEKYDLIFGDAFNDYSVPFHLTTLEFDRLVAQALDEKGLYVVNIVDGGRRGHFLRAYVRTLQRVFPHVAVIPWGAHWRQAARTTFVIVAARQPLNLGALRHRPLEVQELEAYLAQEKPLILSDDFVPVDNLLAPVFEDSARG